MNVFPVQPLVQGQLPPESVKEPVKNKLEVLEQLAADLPQSTMFQNFAYMLSYFIACLKIYINWFSDPQGELLQALTDQDFAKASALIRKAGTKVNLNAPNIEMLLAPWDPFPSIKTTALHRAVSEGNFKLVHFLLDHGAILQSLDGPGNEPLFYALFIKKEGLSDPIAVQKMVNLLLAMGADPNHANSFGQTALQMAGGLGDKNVIDALLLKGADINAKDKDGITALFNAAAQNHYEAVEDLLDKGAAPQFGEHFANFAGHVLMRVAGGDLDPNATDPNGVSILEQAYTGKDMDSVKLLIELGADVNTAFKDKEFKGQTLVHLLASNDKALPLLELALQKGGIIKARDMDGFTPLHTAMANKARNCAKLLLDVEGRGKDSVLMRMKSNAGYTPLHVATIAQNDQLIVLCKIHGAEMNALNTYGHTPLHMAARYGSNHIVDVLCRFGAQTNAIGRGGNTPLHIAAGRKANDPEKEAIIRTLRQNKATIAQNADGKIPDIAEFLRGEQAAAVADRGVGFFQGLFNAARESFATPPTAEHRPFFEITGLY